MKKSIRYLLITLAILASLPAFAQSIGERWDLGQPGSAGAVLVTGGSGYPPIYAVPGVSLSWCGYPAVTPGANSACTNYVTTYTDLTVTTPCSTATPVVLQGASTCVAQGDAFGNLGVYYISGSGGGSGGNTYTYTLSVGSAVFGPYIVTVGGGGSGTCGTGCVLTAPSGSQTITQPAATSLNLVGGPFNVNVASGAAGIYTWGCGTPPSLGSGISFVAPSSCTPYLLILPNGPASGYWQCSDAGTIVTCSFETAVNLNSGDVTGTLPIANGGTGASTQSGAIENLLPNSSIGGWPYTVTGPAWAVQAGCTQSNCIFAENGNGVPLYLQTPLGVAYGGTGLNTQTTNAIYKGNGTSAESVSSLTDNGTIVTTSEFLQAGNTQRLTADSSGITATTPGTVVFTWGALPVSTNLSFHCELLYTQATAAGGVGLAVQGATHAPTRLDAWGKIDTTDPSSTNYTGSAGSALNITGTTATSVVSATPGATATVYQATLSGSIQAGSSAPTLNILAYTGNASDAVVIKAGSYCALTP